MEPCVVEGFLPPLVVVVVVVVVVLLPGSPLSGWSEGLGPEEGGLRVPCSPEGDTGISSPSSGFSLSPVPDPESEVVVV